MNYLFFLSILVLAFCQNKPLIGYIHIDNKLLAKIIGNEERPLEIQVGIKELFAIVLATTSPLRWYLFTPETYPYIICKQKIIDKNPKTDEIIQLFGCKMPYKGESFITIGLGTSNTNTKPPKKINVRINVNASLEQQGPNLTEAMPTEIPTIPPPNELRKSEPPKEKPKPNQNQNNPHRPRNNRDTNRNKEKEEEKEKENPYVAYLRNYRERMQEYFRNMMEEFGHDDYDDDYWSPNRYRSRRGNQRSYRNSRGFPYDSLYYDDDYYL